MYAYLLQISRPRKHFDGSSQKLAIVAPRLKKPTLDADDVNSYRPISNLSFASKLVERVVASRYREYAERQELFPAQQSAYRRYHSPETAVVCVVNDIIRATDNGKVSGLVLLDLTVDHPTLLNVLHVVSLALMIFPWPGSIPTSLIGHRSSLSTV